MRIAYLDCFSGISGDMFLGALVDAGVPAQLLEDTVCELDIGTKLEIARVMRGGISGTKVDVFASGEKDGPRRVVQPGSKADGEPQGDGHGGGHEHGHPHSHGDSHRHSDERAWPERNTAQGHSHGRGLSEIRGIIRKSAIRETAKATALRIFEALGAAEAEIHNTAIERVHFHEVGAVDAIVDIVCAAVGAEALTIDEWVCSPLNVGGGMVQCAHGTLPVPAPATLKLLGKAPIYSAGPQVELVTPTGAAIVKVLASRFASLPAMTIERTGYGAGSRDFRAHANLLRLTIGEASISDEAKPTPGASNDRITVLEANLDDLSPQVLAYAMERLLAEGALDVFSIPAQMKKGRPGALLTVLTKVEDADRMMRTMFAETTTLGVRRREEQRQTLSRRWEAVETAWGPVRIKVATMDGAVSNYAPEFEDCRKLAEAGRVPIRVVLEAALQRYIQMRKENSTAQ